MHDKSTVKLKECPICGSVALRALPAPGQWIGREVFGDLGSQLGLSRCRRCGVPFVNPRPCDELLKTFYAGESYVCHNADSSSSGGAGADVLLDRIEQHLPMGAPHTLLDYGCGGGGFLARAAARGWIVQGFEPGRRGLQVCRQRGLAVTDSLDELPSHSYGLITLNAVFEHLPDHSAALGVIRRLLAPEGRAFIAVPNVRSLRARLSFPILSRHLQFDERYRAFPIHLTYFDASTLTRLLDRENYLIEERFTVGMGIDQLILRPSSHSRSLKTNLPVRAPKRWRTIRAFGKAAILKTGLGDTLCVLCRPMPARKS